MQQKSVNLPSFVAHTVGSRATEVERLSVGRTLYARRTTRDVRRYAAVGNWTARRFTLAERLARALKLAR